MTTSSAISRQVERQAVIPMASTIPFELTIEQWRRQRSTPPCDHAHQSTTRYDHERKLLTFLLVCPVCATEEVVETRHYEPRFAPRPTPQGPASGGTVHQPPARRETRHLPRAA